MGPLGKTYVSARIRGIITHGFISIEIPGQMFDPGSPTGVIPGTAEFLLKIPLVLDGTKKGLVVYLEGIFSVQIIPESIKHISCAVGPL